MRGTIRAAPPIAKNARLKSFRDKGKSKKGSRSILHSFDPLFVGILFRIRDQLAVRGKGVRKVDFSNHGVQSMQLGKAATP